MKNAKRNNKYETNYSIAKDIFDEEETNNKKEINYDKLLHIFFILFFSLAIFSLAIFCYLEARPLKVIDSNTRNFCENSNQDPETLENILDVFEKNGYDRFQIDKIAYKYFPETKNEPETVYIYFKEYGSDEWKYVTNVMAPKWKLSKELIEKIKENE